MLQDVASLIDDAKVTIYDRNMFTIQATGASNSFSTQVSSRLGKKKFEKHK
jgi:hypothetical protein